MAIFIFCCGMRRSASTLQYNIVKEILEKSNSGMALGYAESGEIEKLIKKNKDNNGYFVIKVHDFFPLAEELLNEGKAKIIFSYRDIRDIIVSSMYKWNLGNFDITYNYNYVNILKQSYYKWTTLKDVYSSAYEDIIKDLQKEVSEICNYLNIILSKNDIKEIADQVSFEKQKSYLKQNKKFIKTPFGEMDSDTLLHKNHLRSGKIKQWETELNKFQIATIQRDWKEWILKNNYNYIYTLYDLPFVYKIIKKWKYVSSKLLRKFKKVLKRFKN